MATTDLDEDQTAEESVLEGGAESYEGYSLVGSMNDEDDTVVFDFEDLLPQVKIVHTHGISISLDQPFQNSNFGKLHVRIIHDAKLRVYLFRKDEDGVTEFRISTGLNVS